MIHLFSLIVLFASPAHADNINCSNQAERTAVKAAKLYINPTHNPRLSTVSGYGHVTEVKGLQLAYRFFFVKVTDESGYTYWSIVTDSSARCKVISQHLVLVE